MAGGWSCDHPHGGERLDEDDGKARRRDHGYRLPVCRRPEGAQAGAHRAGRRQGTAPLRQIAARAEGETPGAITPSGFFIFASLEFRGSLASIGWPQGGTWAGHISEIVLALG